MSTMVRIRMLALWGIALAVAVPLGAGACGGRSIPTHDGYNQKTARGWKKPKVLNLDEDNEVEIDAEVSYPKRKRSRWYALDLPSDGELVIDLSGSAIGPRATLADEDDLDLAFEVMDSNFRMLVRADKDEEDAGEQKKSRTLYELRQGRYYIHVWAQERIDEAEFTLRLKYKSALLEAETDFPAQVAFIGDLAVVPPIDDAPEQAVARPRPKPCRGRRCKKPRPRPRPKPDDKPDDKKPVATDVISGRIIKIQAAGGGTKIIINRGQAHGIQSGWRGKVVTSKGKGITDGGFTISTVRANESVATVRAGSDAVSAAARVLIFPK